MKTFVNGALIDARDATVHVTDRGFTLGDGLFETMRALDGKPLRLDRHLARLRNGARLLSLPVPHDDADIEKFLRRTLSANELESGVLRLTLTRGAGARGIALPDNAAPTLVITAAALPPKPTPATAIIAGITRRNEASPLARCKSLNYLDNILAREEANRCGAEEALLLNTRGHLAEATIANLFLVLNGVPVTPPVTDGALPGVMRAEILERFGGCEATLIPDDIARASEAFLSNSLGLRPLVRVDGTPVSDGNLGPVTQSLSESIK